MMPCDGVCACVMRVLACVRVSVTNKKTKGREEKKVESGWALANDNK